MFGDNIVEDIIDAELIANDGLMGVVEAEIVDEMLFGN